MPGYQVGPVVLEATAWPPEWSSWAKEEFHNSEYGGLALRVLFEGASNEHHRLSSSLPNHLGARVELVREELVLAVPDLVEGVYTQQDSTLRLIAASSTSPRMTLGNGLRLFLSSWLPYRLGGLMFHAAAGILDGRGMLFPGISTAGKSTIANGFAATTYLSDDIAIVDGLPTTARLVGTPFFGVNGRRGSPERAPLAAVGILSGRSTMGTSIERLAPARAAQALLRHVVSFTRDPALLDATLARTTALAMSVPVFSVKRDLADDSDTVVVRLLEAISP